MSLEAFPADPALPQLQISSDPELMREVFRGSLCPLPGRVYHIDDCLLSWVRYLRGVRCTLQYTLRLVEPETGRERNQWVSGVICAEDRAERIWRKLRAADPRQEIPQAFPTFEPVSFIPDLGMLVQVFPYDRRLAALPLLMAGPSRDLESLFFTRSGRGGWHAGEWNIEPIRYRTGARAVLRYEVEIRDATTGRTETRRFYVKVYRDEEGEQTYPVLHALWGKADAGAEGFTVGRPIAYLSSLHALLQEEASGTTLGDVLLQGRETASAARRVARALAIFNQGDVATTRRHSQEDEISDLKWVVNTLQWACPHLTAEVEAIIGAIAAGLEEVPPGPTHRDLMPDHVLLDGDRLALLDLDFFAEADPVLDPATLLAQLVGMSLRSPLPHDRVRTAAQAFTEEYFAHVPRTWRCRLPLHYAGAALKVAVGFFRRQEPRWPETIAALVKEAGDSLAGRVW
ncbi:MAG: hypothetical protein AUI49_09645 [Candidatus Rokubacteria bacterium 13_1_40CM_2_68_13]|nr:MAG: hypothetical protein AUI49_09645 [Candidatus Rokubacteria bacterium 13_1_40CM_2_68_13]